MSKLTVIYTGEETPIEVTKSIFLAGPTPRDKETTSWRVPDVLDLLEKLGYDGVVYIPEFRDRSRVVEDYDSQVNWEDEMLQKADCIVFYVPRDLSNMPAFTTNHEHGEWFRSGKVVFGAPTSAPKNRYLKLKGIEYKVPQAETLEETLQLALQMVGEGATRTGGERFVPLQIWRAPSFQSWYKNLLAVGNRLDQAKVEYTFRTGPNKERLYLWILHVKIWVEEEQRYKSNEIVIGRPDISSVVLYYKGTYGPVLILVKEFRSSVNNSEGFVFENPGGSSFSNSEDPLKLAADEVFEETGIKVFPDRVKTHDVRQIAATFSAHRGFLYSVELTYDEFRELKANPDQVFGNTQDSERTYPIMTSLELIRGSDGVDWATLGMIYTVLEEIK